MDDGVTHPFTIEQRATLAFADTFRKDVWFEMPGEFVVLKKPTNPPVCVIAVENPEPCPLEGPIDPEYRPYLEVIFDASWTWDPADRLTNRLWIYAPVGRGHALTRSEAAGLRLYAALMTALIERLRLPPDDPRPLTMLLTKGPK
jgi:hypothetical protein